MGRPRGFDREAALKIALRLFWQHGYEGVSIARLTEVMGIAAPSLYAAFGSKEALYRAALDLYRENHAAPAIRAFQQDGPIRDKVEDMLRGSVQAATDPNHPSGCMLSTGLLFCGSEHASLAATVSELRAERLKAIGDRLQRAVDAGDLAPATDVHALARYLSALMNGIAVQARDGATASDLHAMVDATMERWLV